VEFVLRNTVISLKLKLSECDGINRIVDELNDYRYTVLARQRKNRARHKKDQQSAHLFNTERLELFENAYAFSQQ
jgi:hypothetical protein